MTQNTIGITRRKPQSNIARQTALDVAIAKALNPGVHGNFLTAPVLVRLQNIQSLYHTAMEAQGPFEDALHNNTTLVNQAVDNTRNASSIFVQGINLGIKFNFYQAGNRSYYGLPVDSGKLPPLGKQNQVKEFAHLLGIGEGQRVAAGGTPAPFPPITLVQTEETILLARLGDQSNFKDALDVAQEAVEALNPEADEVILKVWGEVETFFNHEALPSLRANAREWGVVYVSNGPKTPITFQVGGPDLPSILQTRITMKQTGHVEIPDFHGVALFETRVVGPVQFEVITTGFQKQTFNVEIEPQEPQTIEVTLIPKP